MRPKSLVILCSHFSPDDYWMGVFRPSQNQYYYPDCTGVHYKQHLETGWDNSKKCFKIKKDDHVGQRDSCGTNHGFMCEKPLSSGKIRPRDMIKILNLYTFAQGSQLV